MMAGITAAEATGKPWAVPENKGDDWWDVYNRDGKEGVKQGYLTKDRLNGN